MRRSRAITITLLAGLMLTGCCILAPGCGHSQSQPEPQPEPDHTWYDENGNPIEEKWQTDASGNRVLDAEGRPIPHPHVPYDRYRRPWVFTSGLWAPLPAPSGWSTSSSSSWRSPSYRTPSSTQSYRSSIGSSSSHSSSSFSPSSSSHSSPGSSISRGGFGTTGAGSSSS